MDLSKRRAVLVVDDDRSARLILATELAAAGYHPLEASTASEALPLLSETGCHIVVTDWLMPDVDGIALCRRIRSNPALAGVFVMMITVNSDGPRLMEAFEAGVDDFIPKPFEPGILLARMRAAARHVDLQAALAMRNAQLEEANARLAALAATDELTGLANRRHGLACLRDRWAEASRHARDLTVALIDIDRFKSLNDTYGHAIGDRVLADASGVLSRSGRPCDTLCRYGGEEFLVVLPDTDAAGAAALAERWRSAVAGHRITEGPLSLSLTVSIGVATRGPEHLTDLDLLRAADDALYAAKEAGRNLVRRAA